MLATLLIRHQSLKLVLKKAMIKCGYVRDDECTDIMIAQYFSELNEQCDIRRRTKMTPVLSL